MRLALCQLNIVWEDKKSNIEKVKYFTDYAVKNNADIILFPEMSLTGFSLDIAKTKENGESLDIIGSVASKRNIAIGIGWVKDCGDKGENRYTIVDNKGEVVLEYTKLHPFSYSGEDKNFNCGDSIYTFDYNGFNIGCLICYDLRFPEIFQALSKTADLIVVPACWPSKRSEHWNILLKARAIENQCYIAGINCVGDIGGFHYLGDSAVINPLGEVICSVRNEEGVIFADIDNDVDVFRADFPTKKDRRADLYRTLI